MMRPWTPMSSIFKMEARDPSFTRARGVMPRISAAMTKSMVLSTSKGPCSESTMK